MNVVPKLRVRHAKPVRRLFLFVLFVIHASQLGAAVYTVTNLNDSGTGSLRQAIQSANSNPGLDTIAFNIAGSGPFTITLASVLPAITDSVVIDGSTQPGFAGTPLIEINGANIGANNDGLLLTTGGCTIRSLVINQCPRDGIRLQGAGGSVIQGNYLGTDLTGTIAEGNGEGGLMVNGSVGNLVGGTATTNDNVLSGNIGCGLYLFNSGAVSNVVEGNFIGTSATGLKSLGNVSDGIEVAGAGTNIIGGIVSGSANIISGNGQSGIYLLTTGAMSNVIEGNYIGLNANGSAAISNAQDGITIYGVPGNIVGGASAGARNIISGNGNAGVNIAAAGATGNVVSGNYIGTDVTGKSAVPNVSNGVIIYGVPGNMIGGANTGAGNVISGNDQNGVLIITNGAVGNFVQGNFIGVDATGSTSLPNTYHGVTIDGAPSNTIGGGNVISGNLGCGVLLVDAGGGSNLVQGNLIGTDSSGLRPVANAQAGVYITVPGNTVGGVMPSARNVISGNSQNGVFVYGATASNNLILGNYVGTSITGEAGIGNGYAGVAISNAPATIIGGTTAGAGNIISSNLDSGITLGGNTTTATIIQGNYVGTDATGSNALGNTNGGIYSYGSGSNTIGGTTVGAGNLISGNAQEGISIGDPGANFNIIQGNFLGTKADGVSRLGNTLHNIDFSTTASSNLVGGTTPAADNRIAYVQNSLFDGLRIRTGCLSNFVSRNSIFSNGFKGIVVGTFSGGLPNPTNMPSLTEAVSGNGTTAIQGSLNTFANQQFLIQFYKNFAPSPSGYGEGMTYLGSDNVTTGGAGLANFVLTLPVAVPPGDYISATVTDSANNTWEFSTNVQVQSAPTCRIVQSGAGNPAPISINWPSSPPGFVVQQTTNLNPPIIWSPTTNTVTPNGTTNSVTIIPSAIMTVYRLVFQ